MIQRIANCPNCGGDTETDLDRPYGYLPRYRVQCAKPIRSPNDGRIVLPGCGVSGPWRVTEEDAIVAWNTIHKKG